MDGIRIRALDPTDRPAVDARLGKALDDLFGVVLTVDESAPCNDEACIVPRWCEAST